MRICALLLLLILPVQAETVADAVTAWKSYVVKTQTATRLIELKPFVSSKRWLSLDAPSRTEPVSVQGQMLKSIGRAYRGYKIKEARLEGPRVKLHVSLTTLDGEPYDQDFFMTREGKAWRVDL